MKGNAVSTYSWFPPIGNPTWEENTPLSIVVLQVAQGNQEYRTPRPLHQELAPGHDTHGYRTHLFVALVLRGLFVHMHGIIAPGCIDLRQNVDETVSPVWRLTFADQHHKTCLHTMYTLTRSPKSVIGSPISRNLAFTLLSSVGTARFRAFFFRSSSSRITWFSRRALSDPW